MNIPIPAPSGAQVPAQVAAAAPTPPVIDLRLPRSWRRTKDRIATGLMVLAFAIVMVPLVLVLYSVISRGVGIISWTFLTSAIPPTTAPADVGGIGPAIIGTFLITGLATLMAVPLGVLGAVYLNEYGGRGAVAQVVRFMSNVMTGVPSIVMGLFIFSIWVLHFGLSGVAGALALGCLMLPVVIRSSEEMLILVPNSLREGSYALGATRARVTLTVVLPAALGGIVSGSLLAVARAAGETAPLLFTILTVTETNWNVFNGPNTALPSQIFTNATQPYTGAQARAWGAALTLVVIAFVAMLLARFATARFTKQR
jgi:phosphate transport system permease protein